jgi:hypothetical protein
MPSLTILVTMTQFKVLYLILYNSTFTILWSTLLVRIIALNPLSSYENTYTTVGNLIKGIQTAALLEVCHAAIGKFVAECRKNHPLLNRPSQAWYARL